MRASALGVSSVWMKMERVPEGIRLWTGLSEGAFGRYLVADEVRGEDGDRRCRLLRKGAAATLVGTPERETLLQADVKIVDLAGIL